MAEAGEHIQLTEHALECAGWKRNPEQVAGCCCYPDEYFGEKQQQIKPYMFFLDNIQFHYPPHSDWVESYRYWDSAPGKGFFHPRPFENPNFRMADAGFRYYVNKILEKPEEVAPYLGCLLHFLEDATFGIHVLEGPGGADLYTLDRFSGKAVVDHLCRFNALPEFRNIRYTPSVLGADPDEFISMLYARYVEQSDVSRKALFQLAVDFITGRREHAPEPLLEIIYRSSLALVADAAVSVQALLDGKARELVPLQRRLVEFAPFQVPVGGRGEFRFSSCKKAGEDIVYGSHVETVLKYSLPQESYRTFECILSGSSQTDADVEIINRGQVAAFHHLRGEEKIPLRILSPGGIFGIRTRTCSSGGEIRIGSGLFTR